ncbi:hypothetical protein PVK06_018386 [Gossypium arboreum]|uniref:DUF4283 domain-containing protein n=1 Tax=Gossypium arboreum TaxID=29729 RepID=A0ABR0Q592_GOSAR|nr:hypothetical protein PVK06_018386 [Gossypium arboreum]
MCLVGCFLTATTVNFESMQMVMANLWHPFGGVTITDIGEKRFLFHFYCEVDLDRVVKGWPCTFNNHLLVIHTLKEGDDPLEVPLLYANFWVQIHNLPLGMYLEAMAKQFSDFVGVFLDYDAKAIAARLMNCIRIRVQSDICQRLKGKKRTHHC